MIYLQAVKLSTDWMIFSMVHFENEGVHCCASALTLCLCLSLSLFLFLFLQLHNAANTNQKEKYEADLKKEIKKLQVKNKGNQKINVFPLTGCLRCSGLPQS